MTFVFVTLSPQIRHVCDNLRERARNRRRSVRGGATDAPDQTKRARILNGGKPLIVKETVLALLSDMHTGGSTALFVPHIFRGKHQDAAPNRLQKRIRPLWVRSMGEVAKARKNKRLIIVNLGDAIDGIHHDSIQESLFSKTDQASAHVELMEEFLQKTGFSRRGGDMLYYIKGTDSHVGDIESEIGERLKAERNSVTGQYVSDVLTLEINGSLHQFLHHGKGRGEGANEGNALRSFLRNMYYDRAKEGVPQFDAVWSGHTHGHAWESWHIREGDNFRVMDGVICPSWQAKTRYAYKAVPQAVNSVGMVYANIGVDGEMRRPHFVVQPTRDS